MVCFTVVQTEDGVKCNSVIVFGHIDNANSIKHIGLEKIVEKFLPSVAWESAKRGIPLILSKIQVYELKLEHISGKWIDKLKG